MRWGITVLAVAAVLVALPDPLRAEHLSLMAPAPAQAVTGIGGDASPTLDLGITLGRGGFRLGARIFSALGVYGAWLNGQTRADGFSIDGRLQHPDRAFNFTFNADIDAWARRAFDALTAPTVP